MFRSILPENPIKCVDSTDYIVGGVLIYTLTNYLLIFYLPQYLWWGIDLIAVCSFIYGIATAELKMHVDLDIAICAFFLLFYFLLILLLGFFDPLFSFSHTITNQHYVLPFLFPILVFVKLDYKKIRKIYKYLYLGCFISLIYYTFNAYSFIFATQSTHKMFNESIKESVYGGIYFQLAKVQVGIPFIISIAIYYISNQCKYSLQKLVIVLLIIICMVSAMAFGRRSNSVFCLLTLLSPLFVKSLYGEHKLKHIFLIFVLIFLLYSVFFLVIEMFPTLESRWNSDNRSKLISDFFKGFDSFDLVFGKGLHGTYVTSQDNMGERGIIENVFLDIILRTGLLYLIPYLYLILSSSLKGLIRSQSSLITGAAVFLFLKFLMMSSAYVQIFNLDDMMQFFCISLCCSTTSRKSYKYLNREILFKIKK